MLWEVSEVRPFAVGQIGIALELLG
jgi:hypothetical protein